MGTAKWRLALWRYNLKIWARKREGERGSDLNDTNIAWPVRASGPCGRKVAAYFFTTSGFPAGVFPTFWELVFSRQLLSGVEKACRYVDRTGYQRTTSGLCSKMPPTAIWRFFVNTPIAGATDSDRFSRGWVPLLPRWVFLRWRQGKVKRERLKLLDLKTYCQFCSHKRKTVLLVQSDAGLERKKIIKNRLCTCHSISAHVVVWISLLRKAKWIDRWNQQNWVNFTGSPTSKHRQNSVGSPPSRQLWWLPCAPRLSSLRSHRLLQYAIEDIVGTLKFRLMKNVASRLAEVDGHVPTNCGSSR